MGKFFMEEVLGEAIGYLAGLWAYLLVSEFFVARKFGNLWGVFSKKQGVSKDEFSWIIFFTSFIFGLFVMIIVKQMTKKLLNPKEKV